MLILQREGPPGGAREAMHDTIPPASVSLESASSSCSVFPASRRLSTTIPSTDLTALIDAGEQELHRMRAAAAEAARDEDRLRAERLVELRRDFEHNLSVLAERERIIEELEADVVRAERRRVADLEEAERRAAARVSDAGETVRSELEGEYREKARQLHEDMDRELIRRLNQGIRERERDIREEVLESVSAEIERRERTIASLRQSLDDGETARLSQEEAQRERLREVGAAHIENIRVAELKLKFEVELLQEELVALRNNAIGQEHHIGCITKEAALNCSEKDQVVALMSDRVEALEGELCSRQDSIIEKDGKISELLHTLLLVEESLLQKQEEWNEKEDQMQADLKLRSSDADDLRQEAISLIQQLEDDMQKLREGHERECLQWKEREEELLESNSSFKGHLADEQKLLEESRTAAKDRAAEADMATCEIETLRTKNRSQLKEVETFKAVVRRQHESLEDVLKEHNEALERREEGYSTALSESKKSHEAEIREARSVSEETVKCVSRERDEATEEKNAALFRANDVEQKMEQLRRRCSDLESRLLDHAPREREGVSASQSLHPRRERIQSKDKHQLQDAEPQDPYSFDSKMDFPSAFSILSDDGSHLSNIPMPKDSSSSPNQMGRRDELSSLRAENSRLKVMVTAMRTELENLAMADPRQSMTGQGESERPSETDNPTFECKGKCKVCLSMGASERQLSQCRKYIDFFLDGSSDGGRNTTIEVELLRKNFRELNRLVDELRNENRRLSDESSSGDCVSDDASPSVSDDFARQRTADLQEKLAELQGELDSVSTERDRLLDLSNKLRASLSKCDESDYREHRRSIGDYEERFAKSGRAAADSPDIEHGVNYQQQQRVHRRSGGGDFAISSQAVSLKRGTKGQKAPIRATDRATHSQKESYERLQQRATQSTNSASAMGKRIEPQQRKVRNWNDFDDGLP